MAAFTSNMGNYAYKCRCCNVAFDLADLIPRWDDLFDFHGLPIDSPPNHGVSRPPTDEKPHQHE
jgi:hypothetical protein